MFFALFLQNIKTKINRNTKLRNIEKKTKIFRIENEEKRDIQIQKKVAKKSSTTMKSSKSRKKINQRRFHLPMK